MEYILCLFQTVTTANRVKKLVNNDLYSVAVVQAPKSIARSCAYALRFDSRKTKQVKDVCKECDFLIKGMYREKTDDSGNISYEQIEI